jgi:outer membrane biosynthesis protein TonB
MEGIRMNRWQGGMLVLVFAATAGAADPAADPQAFDKKVYDSLRAVHDHGADLYNTKKDFAAAYRVYDGALRTVRPLLDHRPKVQERIDSGLAAAGKEADAAKQAFVLHETIEEVRAALKTPAAVTPKVVEPAKKPEPLPEPKKPEPKPEVKKPEVVKPEPKPEPPPVKKPEPKPEVKKAEPPAKPVDPDRIAPPPRKKGAAKPPASGTARLSGTVTFKGKPLAAGMVVLAAADGTAYSAVTATDGTYRLADPIPPGSYRVAVRSVGVPAKYGDPATSGLTVELKKGNNTADLALQ